LFHSGYVLEDILFGGNGYHKDIMSELCLCEYFSQSGCFRVDLLLVFKHIGFVQNNNQLIDKKLGYDDALCSLCLNTLCDINNQKHNVDDLSPSNDGFQ
jgi:hypothetical protein